MEDKLELATRTTPQNKDLTPTPTPNGATTTEKGKKAAQATWGPSQLFALNSAVVKMRKLFISHGVTA